MIQNTGAHSQDDAWRHPPGGTTKPCPQFQDLCTSPKVL
jgi:hypothetical protein